eukprot:3401811-Rhodomonas_salina.1
MRACCTASAYAAPNLQCAPSVRRRCAPRPRTGAPQCRSPCTIRCLSTGHGIAPYAIPVRHTAAHHMLSQYGTAPEHGRLPQVHHVMLFADRRLHIRDLSPAHITIRCCIYAISVPHISPHAPAYAISVPRMPRARCSRSHSINSINSINSRWLNRPLNRRLHPAEPTWGGGEAPASEKRVDMFMESEGGRMDAGAVLTRSMSLSSATVHSAPLPASERQRTRQRERPQTRQVSTRKWASQVT